MYKERDITQERLVLTRAGLFHQLGASTFKPFSANSNPKKQAWEKQRGRKELRISVKELKADYGVGLSFSDRTGADIQEWNESGITI